MGAARETSIARNAFSLPTSARTSGSPSAAAAAASAAAAAAAVSARAGGLRLRRRSKLTSARAHDGDGEASARARVRAPTRRVHDRAALFEAAVAAGEACETVDLAVGVASRGKQGAVCGARAASSARVRALAHRCGTSI